MPLSILLPFPVFNEVKEIVEFLYKILACTIYVWGYLSDSYRKIEPDSHLNLIPTSTGRNQPIYEYHVTTAGWIGLTIWTSKIKWTSIQTSLREGPGSKGHAGPTRFSIQTSANQFFLSHRFKGSLKSTAAWDQLIKQVQRSFVHSFKYCFVMDRSRIQESCLPPNGTVN